MVRLTCAWRQNDIPANAEVFSLSSTIRSEFRKLAREHEGQIVHLHVYALGRDVPAIVPGADSEAKRDGKDLLFPTCSLNCGKALEATLHDEKIIADTSLG